MEDNISKTLYLGVGVLLLIGALTVFMVQQNHLYELEQSYYSLENNMGNILIESNSQMAGVISGQEGMLLLTGAELRSELLMLDYKSENKLGLYMDNDNGVVNGEKLSYTYELDGLEKNPLDLYGVIMDDEIYSLDIEGQVVSVGTR